MKPSRIALVGDYSAEVRAHKAIAESLAVARANSDGSMEATWVGTHTIEWGDEALLRDFDGIWCVPASPYKNTEGALWAIHFARTRRVPFLGTCGGFQHALLEFVRHELGLHEAAHEELDANAACLLLRRLACPLVEQAQAIVLTGRGCFARWYGASNHMEEFHCRYGLNPGLESILADSPMEIAARSADGEARAIELKGHPFFVGTLFQPERLVFSGSVHSLVWAFLAAASQHAHEK